MSHIATHPMTRLTTGTINPDGVDLVIASAGVDLPETGYGSYVVALHKDGEPCAPECGCITTEDRTEIWEGTTVAHGEWTWHASRYALIGWHSVGLTKPELRERIELLEEALADERELHRMAKQHMNDDSRLIDDLKTQLRAATTGLVRSREGHEQAAAQRDRAERWALGLAVAAVVLAAALVWAVVA